MNSWGKADWQQGSQKEWLVTNGLGGYASSTLINLNTRKYHGLLVAALNPPVERHLLVSQLEERLQIGAESFHLTSYQTQSGWQQKGFAYLQRAENRPVPTFEYRVQELWLQKSIFMVYGQNTTVVHYRLQNGSRPAKLSLLPLVSNRDFHCTFSREQLAIQAEIIPHGVELQSGVLKWRIIASQGQPKLMQEYFQGIFYQQEQERGEPCKEDFLMPAVFELELEPEAEKEFTLLLTAETENYLAPQGQILLQQEIARQDHLIKKLNPIFREEAWGQELALAADAFIVQRQSTGGKSLIAGYPWFNDWGRDAMIALPGLTLVTGRWEDAKEILRTYALNCKAGLIPNTFASKAGEEPLYNTVDASLWFFWAAERYGRYTQDWEFVLQEIYPVLQQIIFNYQQGTHFGIKMDSDGLIQAGSPDLQLTWMDAKVDDWVVTPRQGKAVEIAALWYNALLIMRDLTADPAQKASYRELAETVGQAFEAKFWDEERQYYLDVLDEQGVGDPSFRPNQIIALSLPYSPASPQRAKKVLAKALRELYTPYGLRSLSPQDPAYQGTYQGDRRQRDGAYHQGTVWSWLMGPFITAYRKAYGHTEWDRQQAERFLFPFKEHLQDAGLGYISEILDGNEPHKAQGAIAQAWSVGEVLRVLAEDIWEIERSE